MAISQLSLTDFRNLRSTTLDFHPKCNLVYGNNASGKTSLLEAIHVLCQAQSFRTHQLKQCIAHGQSGFLLFGRYTDFKAGLSKSGNKLEIRVDGEMAKRRSELVRRAPINIVNGDSLQLVDGSPQQRRRFLDWGLFHVEHDYADLWLNYQHALRQRNRLLKSKRDLKLLEYWDRHLIEPSLTLSGMRRNYCTELARLLNGELAPMLEDLSHKLEYCQGWTGEEDLSRSLELSRARDIRSGFTNCGIHRDDLVLTSDGKPVSQVLSRGQSKRLCLALLLGIVKIVNRSRKSRIIMLIDDLHSELDQASQKLVYSLLLEMDLQLFISNISAGIPDAAEAKEFKMFHVEHGIIKPRNFG